jgi:hypothetical protein
VRRAVASWRAARATPLLLALVVLLASCAAPAGRVGAEPFAGGLNQPRGLAFDGAGNLLVAEAGAIMAGEAVTPPVTSNRSGRVSRLAPDGSRATVLDGLPFTHDTATATDVGPADVLLRDGALYVLTAEGHAPLSRLLLRVAEGREPETVANFYAFALEDNLFGQMMGAAGVQSNPYAAAVGPGGEVFVSDGASGRVLRVAQGGAISVFAEVPGMPPLTGLAFGPDGRLYVAVFSVLPHSPGTGAVWAAGGDGAAQAVVESLTMPIDVAFDPAGRMYVLEFGDGREPRDPYGAEGVAGSGRLLRMGPGGAREVLLDGLAHPTAMVFAPNGDLYLAVRGAFSGPGEGEVVRVECGALGVCASAQG